MGLTIFGTQNFLGTLYFFGNNISMDQFFLDAKCFWTQAFFGHTIFLTQNFILIKNCFQTQYMFWTRIFPEKTRDKTFSNWQIKTMLLNQSNQEYYQGQKRLSMHWAWHSSAPACFIQWYLYLLTSCFLAFLLTCFLCYLHFEVHLLLFLLFGGWVGVERETDAKPVQLSLS